MSDQQKEEQFLKKLELSEKLDKSISKMVEGYEEGLTELAFSRYKNENLQSAYCANSYQTAPAMQLVNIDKSGKITLKQVDQKNAEFKIIPENKKQDKKKDNNDIFMRHLLEDDIDYQKEQKEIEKNFRKAKNNFEPVGNFGCSGYDVPIEIKRTRKRFQQVLEAAMEIASVVNEIKINNSAAKK